MPWPTSAKVWSGTIARPLPRDAGAVDAATVYTDTAGELAKTSTGASASAVSVPEAPSTTATVIPAPAGRAIRGEGLTASGVGATAVAETMPAASRPATATTEREPARAARPTPRMSAIVVIAPSVR